MRELIAGEGGSVLVYGSVSPDAVALCCEGLAAPVSVPSGVPVYPVDALPNEAPFDVMRLLPCEPATRAAIQTWAAPRSIDVVETKTPTIDVPAGVKVVAISATSTGSGKTALTRRVARILLAVGKRVVVVRHPLPSLLHWGRFDVSVVRSPDDVRAARPIDEHEELAPIVGTRVPVVTGLDPLSPHRSRCA